MVAVNDPERFLDGADDLDGADGDTAEWVAALRAKAGLRRGLPGEGRQGA
jgi:hypothetical protein